MSKKNAITPMISTVFLIVFAIGLGTLVMSWGSSEHYKADASCNEVLLSITTLNNSKQLCIEDNHLKVLLENNGKAGIKGIKVVIVADDSTIIEDVDDEIKPGEFRYVHFRTEIKSKILKIRIIPYNDREGCVNRKIETEMFGEC